MTRMIDNTGAPVQRKADRTKHRSPKVPLSVGSMRNQCGACGLLFGGLRGAMGSGACQRPRWPLRSSYAAG